MVCLYVMKMYTVWVHVMSVKRVGHNQNTFPYIHKVCTFTIRKGGKLHLTRHLVFTFYRYHFLRNIRDAKYVY